MIDIFNNNVTELLKVLSWSLAHKVFYVSQGASMLRPVCWSVVKLQDDNVSSPKVKWGMYDVTLSESEVMSLGFEMLTSALGDATHTNTEHTLHAHTSNWKAFSWNMQASKSLLLTANNTLWTGSGIFNSLQFTFQWEYDTLNIFSSKSMYIHKH